MPVGTDVINYEKVNCIDACPVVEQVLVKVRIQIEL
jgi:hypothetical protein